MVFVVYLIIPPQITRPEQPLPMPKPQSSLSVSITPRNSLSKIAIVDQLSVHFPNSEFIRMTEDTTRRAGFTTDVYGPDKVTVDLFRSLAAGGYRLIVFRVHSGVNMMIGGGPVALFTAEPYSVSTHAREQANGLLCTAQTFSGSEKVIGILPDFIREMSAMSYDKAVIVLMGCHGLYSPDLPLAFIERGASVVIGWNGFVDVKHTDDATLTLLRAILLDKLSIDESVRATMRKIGADPETGSVLDYYPKNFGSQLFSRLVSNTLLMLSDSRWRVRRSIINDDVKLRWD
jgi:hypothetical protein